MSTLLLQKKRHQQNKTKVTLSGVTLNTIQMSKPKPSTKDLRKTSYRKRENYYPAENTDGRTQHERIVFKYLKKLR